MTTRVSTTASGAQANDSSLEAVFSPDGRSIMFASLANNLVAGDTNSAYDLFIKDLASGAITRISTDGSGVEATGRSFGGQFSPDGSKVVYLSFASNLVIDDTNGQRDIFVRDLATGATTRVSTSATGVQGSGASIVPAYAPNGNQVAFESVATNLVAGDTNAASDIFIATVYSNTSGNDTQTGTAGNDILYINQGGSDTVVTNGGSDGVFVGTALDSTDRITGSVGAGIDNQVIIQGNYTATLTGPVLTNMQTLAIQSGADARWGDSSNANYSYSITLADSQNVAAGATLTINANTLRAGETLFFDGSAETDGSFRFFSGSGNDTLRGGGGNDQFYGRLGADTLTGGDGNDVFFYRAAAESTVASSDTITDFSTGDRIDVSYFDANTFNGAGTNDAFSFIGAAAFTGGGAAGAGQLRAVTTGGANWTIEGDTDGNGVADFSLLVATSDGHAIVAADFVL